MCSQTDAASITRWKDLHLSLWAEHFEPTPTTNWCKRPEKIITTNVLQSRIMITLQQYQYQQQQQHQLHFTAQPQQRFNKLNGKLSSYMWFASFFSFFLYKNKVISVDVGSFAWRGYFNHFTGSVALRAITNRKYYRLNWIMIGSVETTDNMQLIHYQRAEKRSQL